MLSGFFRFFLCRCVRCYWPWCKKRKEAATGEECERLLSNVIDEEACPLSKDQIETYLEKKTRSSRSRRDWRRREGWRNRQQLESVIEDEVEVMGHSTQVSEGSIGSATTPIIIDEENPEIPSLMPFNEKKLDLDLDLDGPTPTIGGLNSIDNFFDEDEPEEVIIGAKRFDRDELGNAQFIDQDAFDPSI